MTIPPPGVERAPVRRLRLANANAAKPMIVPTAASRLGSRIRQSGAPAEKACALGRGVLTFGHSL